MSNFRRLLIFGIVYYISFFLYFASAVNAQTFNWIKSSGFQEYSGYSQDIKVSLSNPAIIYSNYRNSSQSGLLKSTNYGQSFSIVFPFSTNRDVDGITTTALNDNNIWISTYERGIYSSSDGGVSWNGPFLGNVRVRNVTADPLDILTVYAGTGDNNNNGGIYKSIDGGINWTHVADSTIGLQNSLNVYADKYQSGRVFAGSDSDLFISNDSGANWTPAHLGYANAPATVVDSNSHQTIYQSSNSNGVYKSTDGGITWQLKNQGMGNSYVIRLAQDDNGNLFASRVPGGGVWMSNDGAETWTNVADPAWGNAGTWGLDARGGRVYVSVEGQGLFYADDPPPVISPTPTPTPTPTPPPSGPNPVVFVPGFGASWSVALMGLDFNTTYKDWGLIPFAYDYYDPFFKALNSAGLTKNQTYFIFAYDYRKSVQTTASWLNDYLGREVLPKNNGRKANIATHSMGGLIARYCFEKIVGCDEKINKIVMAGTPNWGTARTYLFWDGLKVKESGGLVNLGERLLSKSLKYGKVGNPIEFVHTNFPGLQDLLPNTGYIYKVPYDSMHTVNKNPTLWQITGSSGKFMDATLTLSGTEYQTDAMYMIGKLNKFDILRGLWLDGKPTRTINVDGDDMVILESSQIPGVKGETYSWLKHSDYFRTKKPIEDTLKWFGLSAQVPELPIVNTPMMMIVASNNVTLEKAHDSIQPAKNIMFIKNPNKSDRIRFRTSGNEDYEIDTIQVFGDQTIERKITGKKKDSEQGEFRSDEGETQKESSED